jgi:hypothetical protein
VDPLILLESPDVLPLAPAPVALAPVEPAPAAPAPAEPARVEPVPAAALPEPPAPVPVELLAEACVRMNELDSPAAVAVDPAPPDPLDDCRQPVTVTCPF